MTKDVVALIPRMPDTDSIAKALAAAGPGFHLRSVAGGAMLQLCDEAGRPLLSVEAPLFVEVPGEAARLLGPEAAEVGAPVWWIEARASTAVPEAERLGALFAGRLARELDGIVWPAQARGLDEQPPPDAEVTVVPSPAAVQPAVDILTDRVAVVIQERPVVAMSSWLSDAFRACAASNRALQIVTQAHSTLSLPTQLVLSEPPNRWVIRDERGGFYDGRSGAVLHWRDGAFVPVDAPPGQVPVAPAFTGGAEPAGEQVIVSFRTRQPAGDRLLLGGALEAAWQRLTGEPPTGWGTAEPAGLPWSRSDITALARARSQDGMWFVAVGSPTRPAIATVRISHSDGGVEEDVTLAVGCPVGGPPAVDLLRELAEELVVEYDAQSLLAQARPGRPDLMIPARFEGLPTPLAFALGSDGVAEIGADHARRPPLATPPDLLGPAARPGFFYRLGQAQAPAAWAALEQLMRHLRPTGGRSRPTKP
ncbi:DUF6177 family protein [Kitasatospora sp. NPDC052896]|uniref:DUF6177 family protein n=1 Tax=Kitasatospora sp. NPDC052896 TaxID=3364061 RepID=UPI0037C98ADE